MIIINIQKDTSFHNVFAHELWHHIVNRVPEAQYKAFMKALKDTVDSNHLFNPIDVAARKEKAISGKAIADEEVSAEVFATAMTQKAFYAHLSGSLHGQFIGRQLIARLIENISKLPDVVSSNEGMMYEGRLLFDSKQMNEAYDLLGDMVVGALEKGDTLQHGEIRYHTRLGKRTASELEGYLKKPHLWLQGIWRKK